MSEIKYGLFVVSWDELLLDSSEICNIELQGNELELPQKLKLNQLPLIQMNFFVFQLYQYSNETISNKISQANLWF